VQKVNARRLAASKLGDNQVIKRLFDEIAPRFATRPGGYTRVVKLGPRHGDAAEMVILELVEE
jgi:large subunit ribosomal protein L17